MDYEPIDLLPLCNAGVELYNPATYESGGSNLQPRPAHPPLGAQLFHGLPFSIGGEHPEPARAFLGFGTHPGLYRNPITIPIGRQGFYVLFAHAVLETNLWRGGPVGVEIARYRFHYDGDKPEKPIEVPIRERFEIGNVPLPWGHSPFLCVPDQQDYLMDRYHGLWGHAGYRLMDVLGGVPQGYFIWPWQNPHPEKSIESITILPGSQTFVIAAITIGHLDEFPLVRAAARPVRITLKDEGEAQQPFNLSVHVDRGQATYPYPLPQEPLDQSEPDMRGFGAPANDQSSPAYTHIAATPSAVVTIAQGDTPLGSARWGELEAAGRIETPRIRLEVVDPGRNWVKVTVVDDDTGQPVPCRVAFHSPEGIPYAPHGHHAPVYSNLPSWNIDVGGDIKLGQIAYAIIDGKCEGWLPRGRVLADVARGYEYEPLRTWVDIEPGQQQLTLRLKRWIDMSAQRYFSGDTHVHFLSSQGAQIEARAEDLNVVNLLQSQWGHYFSSTEEFTGRPYVSHDDDTIVYVSQENRQHMLGHLSLLGLKEPVMPWASGGPAEAELGGPLETTLSHWADQAHAQGGTVILPHFPAPNGEAAALIATERVDAVEMLKCFEYEHLEYYRYLNGGYRLPLVGGTDKMSNAVPVGLYRTYVYLPPDEEFNYHNWCKALRKGCTFLSSGAMLWFTVEGQPIGSEIHVKPGGTVEMEAQAASIFPLHTLQIVERGQVIAETTDERGTRNLRLNVRHRIDGDTWLAARCGGPQYQPRPHFDGGRRGIMAHTSPIYIRSAESYRLLDPATAQYMLTLMSGGLAYMRTLSAQHHDGHVTHHHGLQDHIGYLESPFQEALEALHRRMHEMGIPH